MEALYFAENFSINLKLLEKQKSIMKMTNSPQSVSMKFKSIKKTVILLYKSIKKTVNHIYFNTY